MSHANGGTGARRCLLSIAFIIQDSRYHLPGKKVLAKSENEIEVVLIDVSESPIERPKKNSVTITQEKRKNIR